MRALLLLCLVACTDESGTRRALEGAGYHDIKITGHRWNACSDKDASCTGFEATGPTGRRVTGAVGCGTGCGKGCTIRTD